LIIGRVSEIPPDYQGSARLARRNVASSTADQVTLPTETAALLRRNVASSTADQVRIVKRRATRIIRRSQP
jgi:hypothetical protein